MVEQPKKLTPDQITDHEVRKMSNRQMLNHLKKIARKDPVSFKGTWAVVLTAVLENTKPMGRMEPFLR
jgi:hypothetical protein